MSLDGMEIESQGQVIVARPGTAQVSHLLMQEMIDECAQKMRCDNARLFVFDLEDVQFLASACLGVLVSFLQEVEHVRGKIALAGCDPNVVFLFKVTKLDSVFEIYDDLDEALEELTGQSGATGNRLAS